MFKCLTDRALGTRKALTGFLENEFAYRFHSWVEPKSASSVAHTLVSFMCVALYCAVWEINRRRGPCLQRERSLWGHGGGTDG